MSTDETLRREAFDVAALPEGWDLADELQRVNREYGATGAPCWFLYSGSEFPGLTVGLRGAVGAVQWVARDAVLVPANGSGSRVDYFAGGVHHETFPPGAELPVAEALTAVVEYVRTGQRPRCIEWVPLREDTHVPR